MVVKSSASGLDAATLASVPMGVAMRCSPWQVDAPQPHRVCDQCAIPLEPCCPPCEAAVQSVAQVCGGCRHRLPGPDAVALAWAVSPEPAAAVHCHLILDTPQQLTAPGAWGRTAFEGEYPQATALCANEVSLSPFAVQLDRAATSPMHDGRVR
jgi:hypothetical protein